MGMLGAVFSFAVRRELRLDNPVHGVDRHAYEGANGEYPTPNMRPWGKLFGQRRRQFGRSPWRL